MYDEQSVQSTRSSSRASSVAANSPLAQPISSSIVDQTVEYMDIDPESVSVTAQHSQSHSPNVMGYSASSQLDSLFDATMAPISSTISTAAPIRESGPRTRSALQELSTPSASSVHTTSAMGSESLSLSGLASPRGDTSISSSLFPIRPDPDDENDDMDHDVAMDRDSSISPTQPDHGRTQIHQHNHTTDRGQGRRFPGPELFAQIMLSLQESATTSATSGTPSTGTVTSQNTAAASADNDSQQEQPGAARRPGVNPLGRTRLRSSSMRGLFGYQPTSELADAERSAGSETSAADNNTTAEDTNTDGTRTDRNADRLALQIPFFLRLLAEISRMSQATNEDDPEQTDATERPSTLDTMTDGASQHTQHPPVVTHGTDSTAEPSAENGSNPRSRRPNTTIRLIQFGHGIRHARPQSEANVATTEPTGTAATSTDEGQGETEGREGQAGTPGEEINETFIMFLSGPPPDGSDDNESNGPAAPGSDDPESARNRPRHRSPWIVLTLSGAYLNSMMAAGEGEGGSSYDDLWMLANLIGPARPVTTTQEAIDNAGFEVGQFEQALQGMRNVTTLGDSSKCLVCMSEYEEGEDMRALKCHHGFHQACIDKWLTTGANKCPVCRAAAVVTTEPEIGINHANTTPSL
ncbi:hypothetical protein FBU30_008677 [Linnemannia zychae]|nr:hypothetical protein FBU30_008677 [Linnemannia zychae]